MNFETAKILSQRYLAPTVVVILVFAGAMSFVWSEYKEVIKEKDQLAAEKKKFYDDKMLSERHLSEAAIALVERKAELDKQEFVLRKLEEENKIRTNSLKQETAKYNDSFDKLHKAQLNVSREQTIKENEDKIKKLMSEFTALGVDLNTALRCDDTEGLAKYNQAKSKYYEIYTLAEAYGLKEKFGSFLFHNGQMSFWACRK